MIDDRGGSAGLAAAIQSGEPVVPRPAASVVLVRGRAPWEVLLMRRPHDVDFAGGAYVFPGGSVHEEDRAWPDPVRAAAIREAFEEVGILLARNSRGVAGAHDCALLNELLAQGTGWNAALAQLGLELLCERLTLFARWITPEPLRRRFDTSFFVTRAPVEQRVTPSRDEVADWRWLTPKAALDDESVVLVYATQHILQSLASEADAARFIARYRRRKRITAVRPRLVETSDGVTIVH